MLKDYQIFMNRCVNVRVDLLMRGEKLNMPVHVINVDIRDNLEDATIGGRWILQLAQMVIFIG